MQKWKRLWYFSVDVQNSTEILRREREIGIKLPLLIESGFLIVNAYLTWFDVMTSSVELRKGG